MSRIIWRIATEARAYSADDLSGVGAALTGGRWNDIGTPMVYASSSRALACLETLVHLNAAALPLNRYIVEIPVPDPVWNAAVQIAAEELPVGWDAEPAGMTSLRFGTEWVRRSKSALMLVPSVIVPEEHNILINPAHPDAAR